MSGDYGCHSRAPAEVLWVDVKDACSGYSCRGGSLQMTDLEQQTHRGRQRDAFVTGQRQHLTHNVAFYFHLKSASDL